MQRPYIARLEDRRVRGAGARAALAALAPWQPLLADVVLVVHQSRASGRRRRNNPLGCVYVEVGAHVWCARETGMYLLRRASVRRRRDGSASHENFIQQLTLCIRTLGPDTARTAALELSTGTNDEGGEL